MADLACYLSQDGMTAMREEDMIWLFVYSFPGDFFTLLLELFDFFLFGSFCDAFFMAFEADCYFRHSREVLSFEITVTGVTVQTLFEMFLVIKRNRLFSSRAYNRVHEEKE